MVIGVFFYVKIRFLKVLFLSRKLSNFFENVLNYVAIYLEFLSYYIDEYRIYDENFNFLGTLLSII